MPTCTATPLLRTVNPTPQRRDSLTRLEVRVRVRVRVNPRGDLHFGAPKRGARALGTGIALELQVDHLKPLVEFASIASQNRAV